MQIIIDIPDALGQRLQTRWSNLTQKASELLLQAAQNAEIVSPAEAEAAIQSSEHTHDSDVLAYMERQATLYEAQKDQLISTYQGQFVYFEEGKVIDADNDFEILILRIFADSGPRDIFIRQVSAEAVVPSIRTPFLPQTA